MEEARVEQTDTPIEAPASRQPSNIRISKSQGFIVMKIAGMGRLALTKTDARALGAALQKAGL